MFFMSVQVGFYCPCLVAAWAVMLDGSFLSLFRVTVSRAVLKDECATTNRQQVEVVLADTNRTDRKRRSLAPFHERGNRVKVAAFLGSTAI
jgi:hypothetical protein